MASGRTTEAFKIYNHFRSSGDQLHKSHSLRELSDLYPPSPSAPMYPRLATSALIHGLIRSRQAHPLFRVVSAIVEGAPSVPVGGSKPSFSAIASNSIRTKTLEATISTLCLSAEEVAPSESLSTACEVELLGQTFSMRSMSGSRLENTNTRSYNEPNSEQNGYHYWPSQLSEGTQHALTLLHKFRYYRWRRSRFMYDRVFNACLLQGEILTVTLLFAILVKDYQVRSVLRTAGARVEAFRSDDTSDQGQASLVSDPSAAAEGTRGNPCWQWSKDSLRQIRFQDHNRVACGRTVKEIAGIPIQDVIQFGLHYSALPAPFPTSRMLDKIVSSLNLPGLGRSKGYLGATSSITVDASQAALGILARLLEERAIPCHRLTPLIKALQHVVDSGGNGKEPLKVTMSLTGSKDQAMFNISCYRKGHRTRFGRRKWKRKENPSPIQAMLDELILRPPKFHLAAHSSPGFSAYRFTPTFSNPSMLQPMDEHTLNTFLNYTLRHRSTPDPSLALKVIHQMRSRGYQLGPVTAAILIRGTAKLRLSPDLEALLKFVQVPEGRLGSSCTSTTGHNRSLDSNHPPHANIVKGWVPSFDSHSLRSPSVRNVPRICTPLPEPTNRFDPSKLMSHLDDFITQRNVLISILIHQASSNAHLPFAVAVFRRFRYVLTHPVQSHPDLILRDILASGPELFVALISLLVKVGRTRDAKWLFARALRAQSQSWEKGRKEFSTLFEKESSSTPTVLWKPWCLPVQAYTIMLQCYAAESRRGVHSCSRDEFVKLYCHRLKVARTCLMEGRRLYRSMFEDSRKVKEALDQVNSLVKADRLTFASSKAEVSLPTHGVSIPIPDEPFFNAANSLFAPANDLRYIRKFQRSVRRQGRYLRMGQTADSRPVGIDVFPRAMRHHRLQMDALAMVAGDMEACGLRIPPHISTLLMTRF